MAEERPNICHISTEKLSIKNLARLTNYGRNANSYFEELLAFVPYDVNSEKSLTLLVKKKRYSYELKCSRTVIT